MREVTDLSEHHQMLTSLFDNPRTPEEWRRYQLSSEQIAFFHEHGYLKDVRILTGEQVDVLRAELGRLAAPGHPGNHLFYEFHANESEDPRKVLFHALGAWRIEPGFHDILWAPAFRMAAYQLLGGDVRLFHDQLFSKPAGDGGVVAWHQDFSYWTWTQPMAHLTCWIGLDDSSTGNGCLHYIPGSHTWGLLPITGLSGDMDAVKTILDAEQSAAFERKVAMEMPRGVACFHHPLMMHGSYENRSDRQRRATVINVVRDGVWSNADALGDDVTAGGDKRFPILPQGEPLGGQFYPLLFPAAEELEGAGDAVPTISMFEHGEKP